LDTWLYAYDSFEGFFEGCRFPGDIDVICLVRALFFAAVEDVFPATPSNKAPASSHTTVCVVYPLKSTMADLICILSAVLFFTSNLLEIISDIFRGKGDSTNYDSLKNLDADYLMKRWLGEDKTTTHLALASGVIKALAWFSFMVPILQVAWILSRGGKRKLGCHAIMSSLALGGTLSEVISRLMLIGSYQAANWIADDFNLYNWTDRVNDDMIGWRVLQVCFVIVEGME